jgi:hypothetical protein
MGRAITKSPPEPLRSNVCELQSESGRMRRTKGTDRRERFATLEQDCILAAPRSEEIMKCGARILAEIP